MKETSWLGVFLFGAIVGIAIFSFFTYDSNTIIPEVDNYSLKTSEVTCPSCPLPKAVKCDVSDINFTCVYPRNDLTTSDYWQYILPSRQCDNKKVSQMKSYLITQKTGSMRPTISYGDTILTIPYDKNEELVLGDIVSNGKYLHRIVSINTESKTYRTKGDNNIKPDFISTEFEDTEYIVCGVLRGTE